MAEQCGKYFEAVFDLSLIKINAGSCECIITAKPIREEKNFDYNFSTNSGVSNHITYNTLRLHQCVIDIALVLVDNGNNIFVLCLSIIEKS